MKTQVIYLYICYKYYVLQIYQCIYFHPSEITENNFTVPSWFSRCHQAFKILQLELRVGGGYQVMAIGSMTSPPPSSCNRVHNGVAKSGIWLVCLLFPRIWFLRAVVCMCNKVLNHLKLCTVLPYGAIWYSNEVWKWMPIKVCKEVGRLQMK